MLTKSPVGKTKLEVLRFIHRNETVWRWMLEEGLGLSPSAAWKHIVLLKKRGLVAAFHGTQERNSRGQFALGNTAYCQLTDLGHSNLEYLERRGDKIGGQEDER